MNSLTQSKNATILPVLIALTLAYFALSPQARAVCQEGCLTNQNTVLGDDALLNNTGSVNTAIGFQALNQNTTGNGNTAIGFSALHSNTTGRNNTADGQNAMRNNTSGSFNVALGDHAGFNLTTGSNNIEIGNRGVAGEASTIRIGKQETQTVTYIAGISGAT